MTQATAPTALAIYEEIRKELEPFPAATSIYLIPTALQQRSELYRPAAIPVKLDPNPNGHDVYKTPGGAATFCLHSQALERLANAGGMDFDPRMRIHVHDFKGEPLVCDITVGGWYTDSLGQRRRVTGSAKMDLRDGSPRAKIAASPKQLEVARQFQCEQNESRARSRCIRATMGLPSSFTAQELTKTFVAIRWRLDERDPEVRKALIARGTQTGDEVFGGAHTALPEGAPIQAGKADDGDDIEGQFHEAGEEPGIAAPAGGELTEEQKAASDRAEVEAVAEIHRGFEILREGLNFEGKPWSNASRTKPCTSNQYALLGREILTAIAQPGLSEGHAREVRRAVLAFLRGPYEKWDEVTNEQASAAIEWAKSKPTEVQTVFTFALTHDPHLMPLAEAIAAELTKGAA